MEYLAALSDRGQRITYIDNLRNCILVCFYIINPLTTIWYHYNTHFPYIPVQVYLGPLSSTCLNRYPSFSFLYHDLQNHDMLMIIYSVAQKNRMAYFRNCRSTTTGISGWGIFWEKSYQDQQFWSRFFFYSRAFYVSQCRAHKFSLFS